jgi:hypothetical protein
MYSIQEYLFGGATLSDKIAIYGEMPSSKFFETGIIDGDNLMQHKATEVVEQMAPARFNFGFAEYGNPSGDVSATPMQAAMNVARHVQVEVKDTTNKFPVMSAAYPEQFQSEQRKVDLYYKNVILNLKAAAVRGIEQTLENSMMCESGRNPSITKVSVKMYQDGSGSSTSFELARKEHAIPLKDATAATMWDYATDLYAELIRFANDNNLLDKSSVPYILAYHSLYEQYFRFFSYLKKYIETFQGSVHGDGSLVSSHTFSFDNIRFVNTYNPEYSILGVYSGVFFKRKQYKYSVCTFDAPVTDILGNPLDKYTYSQLAAEMAKTDPVGAQAMFGVNESQIKSQLQLGKQKQFGGNILQLIMERIATSTSTASRGQLMTMRGLATAVPAWAHLSTDAPVILDMLSSNISFSASERESGQMAISESQLKTMGQVVDKLSPNGKAEFTHTNGEVETIRKKDQKSIY